MDAPADLRTVIVRFGGVGCAAAILVVTPVIAQPAPSSISRDAPVDDGTAEVVVTGDRRSIAGGITPLASLDAGAIVATGATTMPELLRAIRGVTQAADGSDPIFLLNAQRVSGYQDIGTLPPEAIERVEVLPEPAALKFGYPPTRRVLNFITKRRFRQAEIRGSAAAALRGGGETGTANLGFTRLRGDGRLTAALEYRHSDPVLQSDRRILPDPDIPYDAIGNVTGVGGGEIDPALSARAGQRVTVAAVPERAGDRTLAGFAGRANAPRVFDLGPYRTLMPIRDAVKGETVLAGRIGGTLAGSISLSGEQIRERNLAGPAVATLFVPAGNPFSPFAGPVLLDRYLIEADPLRQRQTTTTLHGGATLRGVLAGWRWDVTTAFDQQRTAGRTERNIDLTAANAAIAGGADPFAPIAPALLTGRQVDIGRLRTRTGGAKAVVTNTPVRAPAGPVSITASAEAERATAMSSTRGPNPFALRLGRDRIEGSIAIDVPITSVRADVLPFLGDLSINGSANARDVGGYGALHDTTWGVTWGLIPGLQLLGTMRRTAAAPAVAQLSNPQVQLANIAVFDSITGRTELVTLLTGGNPDLRAERRQVRTVTANLKPFATREMRIGVTYEAATIRDQTATVYSLNALTEAIVPGLATRDADGRLVTVAYRPINFFRQRQRTLTMTANASGMIGTAPPPNMAGKPDTRPSFYGGGGPILKLRDRLQLTPGAPVLDVLRGDTVVGYGTARVSGYAYGGINQLGTGMTFDLWYGGASRARNPLPAADLRFAPILKMNVGGIVGLDRFVTQGAWARKLQLKIDVNNITDARPRVRDGNGVTPNRFQPGYLDPVGRMVTLSLRKLF